MVENYMFKGLAGLWWCRRGLFLFINFLFTSLLLAIFDWYSLHFTVILPLNCLVEYDFVMLVLA